MKKVSYITVVGVVALGAVIYLIWKKRKENAAAAKPKATAAAANTGGATTTTTTANTGSGAGSTGGSTTQDPIIYFTQLQRAKYFRKGDSGEDVKALQSFLNENSSYNLVVDGVFGQATENAVFSEYPITKNVTLDSIGITGFNRLTNKYVNDFGLWESLYSSSWYNF
jgi:hypothetical protein